MRVILRRGATTATFLAVFILLLQVGDSIDIVPPAQTSPALQAQAPFGMAAGSDHEFYLRHAGMIPIGRMAVSVPILVYHYIRQEPPKTSDRIGWNLTVTPENFQAQMTWLATNGYHPIDFNDLRAYFAGRTPLPSKALVITFDDGYKDLYTTAYPILQSFGFKAVAYIVTSFVGQPRYVTAAEIVEMDRHGIQIGSHTVDHPDLARTSTSQVTYQMSASKAWLQRLVGHQVIDFAYPSGKFNAAVVGALQATGYDTAVTVLGGTIHSRADRYLWTRIRVSGSVTLPDFVKALGPVEPFIDVSSVAAG